MKKIILNIVNEKYFMSCKDNNNNLISVKSRQKICI